MHITFFLVYKIYIVYYQMKIDITIYNLMKLNCTDIKKKAE